LPGCQGQFSISFGSGLSGESEFDFGEECVRLSNANILQVRLGLLGNQLPLVFLVFEDFLENKEGEQGHQHCLELITLDGLSDELFKFIELARLAVGKERHDLVESGGHPITLTCLQLNQGFKGWLGTRWNGDA